MPSLKKVLIGSSAIKHYYPEFKREPNDIDYAVNIKGVKPPNRGEEYLWNYIIADKIYNDDIISMDDLLTLKISHVTGWDLPNDSWSKHMYDIQFLLSKGHKMDINLFYLLYGFHTGLHGINKRSDLDMKGADFFNNAVNCPYDHDNLHDVLITHPYFKGQKKPTYSYILKDNAEVNVDEDKFNKLSEEQKFNLVFEEIACMSVERYPKSMHYRVQYEKMLKKFIINHAPLWEAMWIILNYKKLLLNLPFDFARFLNNKMENI